MSERDEIIEELRLAFDTDLIDTVVRVTITKYDTNDFTPSTASFTKVPVASQTIDGIFTGHWQYEVFNANAEPNDETLLILQDDLSFKPEIACMVESLRGLSRVIEVRSDPMRVTWELRIRY